MRLAPTLLKAACTVWWGGWWKRAVRHRALSLPNADGGTAVIPCLVVQLEVVGGAAPAAERER